jgi:hypothetical protein
VSWLVALVLAGDLDRARDRAVGEARALLEVAHAAALDLACRQLVELAAEHRPAEGPAEPGPGGGPPTEPVAPPPPPAPTSQT